MSGYIKNGIQLKEVATPSTPSTNLVKVYAKSDGIYYLDDTGTETKLSGGASGGIDEHVYALSDFNLTNTIKTITAYSGAMNFAVLAMDNMSPSTIKSPLWRASQPIIDNIAAGESLFIEVDFSAVTTGATDIIARLTHWDNSALSYSVTSITKTATVLAVGDVYVLEYEFNAITPAFLDRFAVELYRGTAGTLGNSFIVSEVRILTKAGAGS